VILGNDIVALGRDSGRSGQAVFYSKMITPPEKQLYSPEKFPRLSFPQFVWLCWAVKEAAFKCITRTEPGALYWGPRIPIMELLPLDVAPGIGRFECDRLKVANAFHYYSALARFGSHRLQAWVMVGPDCLLAVATNGDRFDPADFDEVHWGIRRLDSTDPRQHSTAVRTFAGESFRRLYPGQSFSIAKAPAGYPYLIAGGESLDAGLSLSHHEQWVAYAFEAISAGAQRAKHYCD
jgi:hypothetical protein